MERLLCITHALNRLNHHFFRLQNAFTVFAFFIEKLKYRNLSVQSARPAIT